jgi:acyl dehydratase
MGRSLVAVNTAPDSENRMHGDEARRFGFAAGLVPGVDVLGYLAHEGVTRWGAAWLGGGRLHGRLDAPVYDGERVEVEVEVIADRSDARVVGADGDVRARATLSTIPLDPVAARSTTDPGAPTRAELLVLADPAGFGVAPRPDPAHRPPASGDLLAPGTVLGTQRARFHADRAPTYLDEIAETHPAFRDQGCAHPGWLLRFANWALSGTVRLGPWIHVSSDASFLAPVRDGDELEVRARVTDRFEAKGHEFVDLRVAYLVGGAPVVLVDHRAIWQPRARAGG